MCHDYHRKSKSWDNRGINLLETTANTLDSSCIKANDEICNKHKKELVLLSKPCNLAICQDCVQESHQQHNTKELTALAVESRYSLQVRKTNLKSRISSIEDKLDRVRQEEQVFCKKTEIVQKDLKVHASHFKEFFCKAIDNFVDAKLRTIELEKR